MSGLKTCFAGWALLTIFGWLTGLWAPAVAGGLALLPLPVLLAKRRGEPFDPFEPIWPLSALFAFTYLLVPVLESLDADAFLSLPGYLELAPLQLQFAMTISGLAFIALNWGYFGPVGAWVGHHAPALRSEPSSRGIWLLGAVLFAFGVASLAAAVQVSGSKLSVDAMSSGELRRGVLSAFGGRGYLSLGLSALALSAPLAALWFSRRPTWQRGLTAGLVCSVAFALLVGVAGSRLLALQIPISVAVVVHYELRRFSLAFVASGGLAIIILGVAILQARSGVSYSSPLRALGAVSLTLDGFNFLGTSVARTHHFLFGQSLLEDIAYTYFPRSVWADKPLIYGMVRVQDLVVPGLARNVGGPNAATFPVGLVAEGYVNLGTVGALALPAFAGALCRAVRERAKTGAPIFIVLLAWLVPNELGLMRGVGGTVATVAITLLLLSPLALHRRQRTTS